MLQFLCHAIFSLVYLSIHMLNFMDMFAFEESGDEVNYAHIFAPKVNDQLVILFSLPVEIINPLFGDEIGKYFFFTGFLNCMIMNLLIYFAFQNWKKRKSDTAHKKGVM